ncbi:hypothetical protein C8J56DRAFT_1025922 [Mycena floridula]|nr:hypothetical protein C8J56DRAFT_1025922 [Mycena floridula]
MPERLRIRTSPNIRYSPANDQKSNSYVVCLANIIRSDSLWSFQNNVDSDGSVLVAIHVQKAWASQTRSGINMVNTFDRHLNQQLDEVDTPSYIRMLLIYDISEISTENTLPLEPTGDSYLWHDDAIDSGNIQMELNGLHITDNMDAASNSISLTHLQQQAVNMQEMLVIQDSLAAALHTLKQYTLKYLRARIFSDEMTDPEPFVTGEYNQLLPPFVPSTSSKFSLALSFQIPAVNGINREAHRKPDMAAQQRLLPLPKQTLELHKASHVDCKMFNEVFQPIDFAKKLNTVCLAASVGPSGERKRGSCTLLGIFLRAPKSILRPPPRSEPSDRRVRRCNAGDAEVEDAA